MANKSYAYLLNVESSNLVFSKTDNTEFDDIIITFTDQNGTLSEVEDKVHLAWLINNIEMACHFTEPRTRKYLKGYGLLTFGRNLSNKYGKNLLSTTTKNGLDAAKAVSKKVVHKIVEATA